MVIVGQSIVEWSSWICYEKVWKYNESQKVDFELSNFDNDCTVLGRIHMYLQISDSDLSTRICRLYDYIPRATDPDLYPWIWELVASQFSIKLL